MDNEQPHQELVKCVLVGDTAVGKIFSIKSSLLYDFKIEITWIFGFLKKCIEQCSMQGICASKFAENF